MKLAPRYQNASLEYWYSDNLLIFDHSLFGDYSKSDFKRNVSTVTSLLKSAKNKKGKIPEEAIYYGAMVRLFDRYDMWLGEYQQSYNLKRYPKCREFDPSAQ